MFILDGAGGMITFVAFECSKEVRYDSRRFVAMGPLLRTLSAQR